MTDSDWGRAWQKGSDCWRPRSAHWRQRRANLLEPTAIVHPAHMPAGELRLVDPDGYVLLIGQLRPKP